MEQTVTEREKMIDKIRKLQAHSDSAHTIGNEAEAQAFAAKVQELLTAYKLSQADIGSGVEPDEPVNVTQFGWKDLGLKARNKRVAWVERLASHVGKAYYCEFVIVARYGNIGYYVGTETDRQVAIFMFITLARFLHDLANREARRYHYEQWKAAGSSATGAIPEEAHGFKAGFITGFIKRLWERFDDEIRPKTVQDNSKVTAIVLLRKDALSKVRDWMDENLDLKKVQVSRIDNYRTSNNAGRERGRSAADEVNLRPNVVSNTGSERN
jgi:hypothetical protein